MALAYPLIETKIRPPRRPRTLLRRERLVDYIHESIQHKLILVAAGAGYGKTSLLIDYVHDTDLPVCWLSLDSNDAHSLTFLEYLLASIRERFPQFGGSVEETLRDYTGDPHDVEPFVRLFVHEIKAHVPQYFVIVLDDYHEVIASESVNAFVDGLLRYLPEHAHVIIASRGIPRLLTLTRLAARQEVVGLGAEHLRFTGAEIFQLLELLGQVIISREQADLLAERAEGWITGILLAAQAHWTGVTQDILELSGASGGVFAYMADQVLARQPAYVQEFLMGSALLSEMTPPLCDALLTITNSAQILRELSERNLFTFPLDAEQTWYQYHQLFREFLVARLAQEDPVRYRRLSLKQAEIMVHQGDWPEAIRGYLSAQAHGEAADAIEIVAQSTFQLGDWAALRDWIEALPETILAERPRLLLYRARIHLETGELDQALPLLAQSYRGFAASGADVGAAQSLIQRAVAERFRGRLDEAIRVCRQVLEMVGDRDPLVTIQAQHNIGICRQLAGRYDLANAELERALAVALAEGDDTRAAYITSDIGVGQLQLGHLASARKAFHQALLYWRKIGNPSALAIGLQGLGVVHHYLGQYAEADNRFEESLAKARLVGDVRVQAFSVTDQGDLYRDTGRYEDAIRTYREALDLAATSQTTHLMIYVLTALSITYAHAGDLAQARQLAAEALDQVNEEQMVYEAGLCHLAMGIWACKQGDLQAAVECLLRARERFERSAAKRDVARARLYLAIVSHVQGDKGVGQYLRELADLRRELGTHQFIVAEGPAVLPPLDYADQHAIVGLDGLRVRAEIEQLFGLAVREPTPKLVAPEAPIEFLGLNGGQILRDGQVVTDWESASARILAFLFASHPAGLRRDRVIDMLWPEVSDAKGNSLFHSTMYRLRMALSRDVIVYDDGVYRISPECPFRYDVLEFQRLARLARGDNEEAHVARLQAIDLYRSPFLETCDYEWCDEIRHSLQGEMQNLLLAEADYLIKANSPDEAELFYRRALGMDSYDERAHRGIMRCRAARQDRIGALRQFNECARILSEELDVEPSSATLVLYQRIRSGQDAPIASAAAP